MAPPANISVDALIAVLSNERVVEAFAKMLQPIWQKSIDAALDSRLGELRSDIDKLSVDLHERDAKLAVLEKDNVELRKRSEQYEHQIDALESYSRVDNVIIYGLPESYAESTSVKSATAGDNVGDPQENSRQSEKVFLDLCTNQLGVSIQPGDISICHRLRKSAKAQFRPLIVRFTSRKTRSLLLSARKKLKGSKVFVSEHLTKRTSNLFAAARAKVKDQRLAGAWTKDGRLYVKELDTGYIRVLNSAADLQHF